MSVNTLDKKETAMDNFFARDSRIDQDSALRNLEKKVHYLIAALAANGLLLDPTTNNVSGAPAEVMGDAQEVANNSGE
jgi:hypothetical protein